MSVDGVKDTPVLEVALIPTLEGALTLGRIREVADTNGEASAVVVVDITELDAGADNPDVTPPLDTAVNKGGGVATTLVLAPVQLTLGGVNITDGIVGHVDGENVLKVGTFVVPPSSTPLSLVLRSTISALSSSIC